MSNIRVPDINSVTMVGRLIADPELRHLASGSAVCTFTLAHSSYFKNKGGEKCEDSTFIKVEIWNKSAEYCAEHLKKGQPVVVEGSLKQDEWQDKDTGKKRTAHKIKASKIQQLEWANGASGVTTAEPKQDDDIPF